MQNLSLNIPLWFEGNTSPNFYTDFLIWPNQGFSVPIHTLEFSVIGGLSLLHRDKLV